MRKAVMALSGGMDSATLLVCLLKLGYEVECVSFVYGSKHNPYEQACAEKLAEHYDVKLHKMDLSPIMAGFNSDLLLSGGEIPEGHYTDASMSRTVVPGRNIIFLSIMSGLAWSIGASVIGIGIHSGDHAIYPDCRPDFYNAMNQAIMAGTDQKVRILAPFINDDKTSILKWGLENGVPYEFTRTCYKAQELSCGKCGSCVERLFAFADNQHPDPIAYEDDSSYKKYLVKNK